MGSAGLFLRHAGSWTARALAAVLVVLPSLAAHAGQVPSLSQDMIPPDMPPEVRKLVLQLYSDNIPDILAAEKVLGEMGPEAVSAAPFLTSMLPGHFGTQEANEAALALVRIGKGAFDAVAVGASPAAGEARRRSVLVLARIDGPRTLPLVLDLFAAGIGRPYDWVALRLAGESSRDFLLQALASPDAAKRRGAVRALPALSGSPIGYRGIDGHSANQPAPPWCRTQEVVNLLLKAASDSDAEVRLGALTSLADVAQSRDTRMPLSDPLRTALGDADATVRHGVIGLVIHTDDTDKAKFDALEPLLADPVPGVRAEAVAALGGLRNERARLAPLLAKLLQDPDPFIRLKAARSLGELCAPEGEAALLAGLKDEVRPVRMAAVKACGLVGGRAGLEALMELARHEPDQAVRLEAVSALSATYLSYCRSGGASKSRRPPVEHPKSNDDKMFDALFQTLAEMLADPCADLHLPAVTALGKTPREAGKDVIPFLAMGLRSPDGLTCHNSQHLIMDGRFYDKRLLAPLHECLLRDSNPGHMFQVIDGIRDRQSIPVFQKLAERGGMSAPGAIAALADLGDEGLALALKYLGHAKDSVREDAAKALSSSVGQPKVAEFIRATLRGEDARLRDGAQRLLAHVPEAANTFESDDNRLRAMVLSRREAWRDWLKSDPAKLVQAALALLHDPDRAVRSAAAHVLGASKDRKAVPALCGALADASPEVRVQVLEVLADMGDATAAQEVVKLLSDPDEGVREVAALSLGKLTVSAMLKALTQALHSPDWHLRRGAAQSLGAYSDARAREALTEALAHDPHWCVRQTAAAALGRKVDLSRVPVLIAALEDEHWYVRCASREALTEMTKQKLGDGPEAWRMWANRQGKPTPSGRGD